MNTTDALYFISAALAMVIILWPFIAAVGDAIARNLRVLKLAFAFWRDKRLQFSFARAFRMARRHS